MADAFLERGLHAAGICVHLGPLVGMQRELVQQLGGFDETLFGAEDTDLWIRLAARGGFACIDEPLTVVLKRPGSVSRNREAMRRGAIAMTHKNRALLPPAQRGAFWRALYAGTLCDYAKWFMKRNTDGVFVML